MVRAAFVSDTARQTVTIPNYSRAAVLVPLVETDSSLQLLFTMRTNSVETHKGQISFPGGMVEKDDNDLIHTAVREAEEEIGLPSSAIEIVGMLDDMATPTGFIITPVVGTIRQLPPLAPNPDEVEEVFQVPLAFFLEKENGRSEQRELKGKMREIWFYEHEGKTIWGVTAFIIRSLVSKLRN